MFYNIYTTKENNKKVLFSLMNSLGFNMNVKSNDDENICIEVKDVAKETFDLVIDNLNESGLILKLA
jgi:hypothetical protein